MFDTYPMYRRFFTLLIIVSSPFTAPVFGDEDTQVNNENIAAILRKADTATGAGLGGIRWQIGIVSTDSKGDVDEQTMQLQAVDNKWVAETLSPLRSRGQKILMIKRNMWFSKPGLRKPVPISMRQRLSGGASNGDVASTNYAGDYTATRLEDEIIDEQSHYVFDLVAKTKSVTYDKVKYWVSQDSGLGAKAEFYSRSGKHLKTASFAYANTIVVDGESKPFLSTMNIVDELNGNHSQFSYGDVEIKSISATAFRL